MDFTFKKMGSDITLQDLSMQYFDGTTLYFEGILKDSVVIGANGVANIRRTKDIFYIDFDEETSKVITKNLNLEYFDNIHYIITEDENELIYSKIIELREIDSLEIKTKRTNYDKEHFINGSEEKILIKKNSNYGIYIVGSSESIILKEFEDILIECNSINILRKDFTFTYDVLEVKNVFKEFIDEFKVDDLGDYIITYSLEIPFNEFKKKMELIKTLLLICKLEIKRLKLEEELKDEQRIDTLIAKAKIEGVPQVVSKWTEPCNDDNEACDVDEVIELIDKEGNYSIIRNHTW